MNLSQYRLPFVKASACGNDFLLIESASAPADTDIVQLTQRLCDRHNGVGADGVEWMASHPSADIAIRLINTDGSEAEISGNGTRCVAAYLCASQGKKKIRIQTGAGLKTCTLTARCESDYEFEIEMGVAAVEENLSLQIGDETVTGTPVSLGNPHYVIFVPEFPQSWQARAAEIQSCGAFKHGVNVEMVVIDGSHDLRALFFERGAGETQSSGTGSCASAVAAIAAGKAESPVHVHAPGGTQIVRKEGDSVFLRGSARIICQGDFFLS